MTASLPPDSIRLIESLRSPEVYGSDVGQVELLETHISWVLLAGDLAYKIKKPVDFGFVDFRTLDRRRVFCEEELRLNRRLAPKLYLAVVPITGTIENPLINGEGEALEYAVKMQRFPQEALLNHAIENGMLHPEHIDELGREIAEFHQQIAVARPDGEAADFGTEAHVLNNAWDNFRTLLEADIDSEGNVRSESESPEDFQPANESLLGLLAWTQAQAKRLSQRFDDRRNEGQVRECHGDMHLGNMLLENEKIVIFDGIEFNPELRWIDVMNEIAFCLMDLADRNRPDYAHRLLNIYLEHSGDYGGLDVLPFYITYRALVRAKVAHLRYKQQEPSETSLRQELKAKRQEYIHLATKLIEPKKPLVIITHGLSGSGKSFGTQSLVESLGAVRVRSDVERKRLAGLGRLAESQSKPEAGLYSAASTEATYHYLAKCAEHIIAAGYPAILDATFLKASHRAMMRDLAKRLDVPYVILDFEASEAQLRERITKRLEQGADPSEANLEVLEHQLKTREPLTPEEQLFVIAVKPHTRLSHVTPS